MMDGDISVASEPGRGATFTVRLPAAAAETAVAAAPVGIAPRNGSTILVVDDDATARELISHYLEEEGFAVVAAANGMEALKLAREIRPVAITLDVVMPDLSGWNVLSALKGDPALAAIPVVMVTITDEKRRAFALGAAGYVMKPIERTQLLALMAPWRASRACDPGAGRRRRSRPARVDFRRADRAELADRRGRKRPHGSRANAGDLRRMSSFSIS